MRRPEKVSEGDRAAILRSYAAGVVPPVGCRLLHVGRERELEALDVDLQAVTDGRSFVRFLIGRYGTGKSFMLSVLASAALERRMVVARADLTPDRRLHGSSGQGRALHRELMRNVSTRSKPNGGALAGIVERFIAQREQVAKETGQTTEAVISGMPGLTK